MSETILPFLAHYRPQGCGKQSFIYNAQGRWIWRTTLIRIGIRLGRHFQRQAGFIEMYCMHLFLTIKFEYQNDDFVQDCGNSRLLAKQLSVLHKAIKLKSHARWYVMVHCFT